MHFARRLLAPSVARGIVSDTLAPPTNFKGSSHPLNPDYGKSKNLQMEDHVNAEYVLEEERTGFAPGLPLKYDGEVWANPSDPEQLVRGRPKTYPAFCTLL